MSIRTLSNTLQAKITNTYRQIRFVNLSDVKSPLTDFVQAIFHGCPRDIICIPLQRTN